MMHARTHACSHALRPCPPRARPCWAGETSWGSRAAVCGVGSMRNRFRVPRASWYHVALEDCPQIALKKTEPLLPTVPKGACGWVEEGVAGAQRRTCLARPVSSYADAGQSAHGEAARRAGSGWLPLPPRPQSPPCPPRFAKQKDVAVLLRVFLVLRDSSGAEQRVGDLSWDVSREPGVTFLRAGRTKLISGHLGVSRCSCSAFSLANAAARGKGSALGFEVLSHRGGGREGGLPCEHSCLARDPLAGSHVNGL